MGEAMRRRPGLSAVWPGSTSNRGRPSKVSPYGPAWERLSSAQSSNTVRRSDTCCGVSASSRYRYPSASYWLTCSAEITGVEGSGISRGA